MRSLFEENHPEWKRNASFRWSEMTLQTSEWNTQGGNLHLATASFVDYYIWYVSSKSIALYPGVHLGFVTRH